ncbi:MAG: helix-turn-helix transcriptional regulator [Pirellulales bacterium]|nr:helix-turn-helix transcriptional regulator [Pirellulales bacterium]
MLREWLAATPAGDWTDDEFACTERAAVAMRENLHKPISIDRIARTAGVSPVTLRRAFASRVGLSPKKFYNRLRMNEAARLLRTGSTVAETATRMGFSDAFHFSRAFKSYFQVAPKTKKPSRVGRNASSR